MLLSEIQVEVWENKKCCEEKERALLSLPHMTGHTFLTVLLCQQVQNCQSSIKPIIFLKFGVQDVPGFLSLGRCLKDRDYKMYQDLP